jgi:hypothetical protein
MDPVLPDGRLRSPHAIAPLIAVCFDARALASVTLKIEKTPRNSLATILIAGRIQEHLSELKARLLFSHRTIVR